MNNHSPALATKSNNVSPIGLDKKKSRELAKKLNTLLGNYSIFYQNVRGYHWNLKGENFFVLHLKFEELYNSLALRIDEIAERILTIGHPAEHNFSHYALDSKIVEKTEMSDGIRATVDILSSLRIVISLQREILTLSDELGDEGTYNLMSDVIKHQEKQVWMYSSYLGK